MRIYSVRFFDINKDKWLKKGVRVEAETSKEAYEKALEIKNLQAPQLSVIKLVREIIEKPKKIFYF